MRFGSVCSGIEAASVAWEPLGWQAAWFAEIEPFPSAVLKYHYANVPNLGDMTRLPEMIRAGEAEAPEVFCGGTPCQAFSVAGLRKSLDDARGNLSLTFCEIANAIDHVRSARGEPPAIVFWENVPGVLSTKDNAFGCFLAGLAGEDEPLQPPGGKWTDAGVVLGPARAIAWRVFNAEHFGLAQRRKRVFVVASAREGFDPVEVLLEFEGLRRDSAPSREAGQSVAPTIAGCANGGGANGPGRDVDSVESLQVAQPYTVANCLTQRMHKGINTTLDEGQTPVLAHTLRGEGFDASEDGTGRETPLVPVAMVNMQGSKGNAVAQADGPSFTLNAMHGHDVHAIAVPVAHVHTMPTMLNGANTPAGHNARSGHTKDQYIVPAAQPVTYDFFNITAPVNRQSRTPGDPCHTLARSNAEHAVVMGPVGIFQDSEFGVAQYDSAGTLRAGRIPEHQMVMQPVAFHPTQDPISSADVCHAIGTGSGQGCATAAVAMRRPMDPYLGGDITIAIDASYAKGCGGTSVAERPVVEHAMQVRRLTPVECERLQGFPDNYTAIPWRNKPASECPDGPRYKALGNSWAVPCVRWIGRRIHNAVAGRAA